jgi:arsenate reductase
VKLLDDEGIDFARVDYFVEPLSAPTLSALLRKAGLEPRDALRKRDKAYAALGLDDPSVSDADIIRAMVEHPGLLERPLVERGDRAVLGRPIERVLELL